MSISFFDDLRGLFCILVDFHWSDRSANHQKLNVIQKHTFFSGGGYISQQSGQTVSSKTCHKIFSNPCKGMLHLPEPKCHLDPKSSFSNSWGGVYISQLKFTFGKICSKKIFPSWWEGRYICRFI